MRHFNCQAKPKLTRRDAQVLWLVERGRSNEEIAARLYMSPHTANWHVDRLLLHFRECYPRERIRGRLDIVRLALLERGRVREPVRGG